MVSSDTLRRQIPPNPCTRDCQNRSGTCHAECEAHLSRRRAQQAYYDQIAEEHKADDVIGRTIYKATARKLRKYKR